MENRISTKYFKNSQITQVARRANFDIGKRMMNVSIFEPNFNSEKYREQQSKLLATARKQWQQIHEKFILSIPDQDNIINNNEDFKKRLDGLAKDLIVVYGSPDEEAKHYLNRIMQTDVEKYKTYISQNYDSLFRYAIEELREHVEQNDISEHFNGLIHTIIDMSDDIDKYSTVISISLLPIIDYEFSKIYNNFYIIKNDNNKRKSVATNKTKVSKLLKYSQNKQTSKKSPIIQIQTYSLLLSMKRLLDHYGFENNDVSLVEVDRNSILHGRCDMSKIDKTLAIKLIWILNIILTYSRYDLFIEEIENKEDAITDEE